MPALTPAAGLSETNFFESPYPIKEYMEQGIEDASCKSYYGQEVFGIYDTNVGGWILNDSFTHETETEPVLYPPEDAVSLIAEYEEGKFAGFRVIDNAAFYISLPTRKGGIEAFDRRYGQYKPFGFDRYGYSDQNVRKNVMGFWDETTQTILVNMDPGTGFLYVQDDFGKLHSVYLTAVYDGETMLGLKVISEEEFHAIKGVMEHVNQIHAQYFGDDNG
ncbi:MAG: hypothetical protein FWF69_06375 [Firmicutes bacterium]|nr:hypothetical protein [Bacillota bacterium]